MTNINPKIRLVGLILQNEGCEVFYEYKFLENRKFRFDLAIPSIKIAIEYEGIYRCKSRHITISGFERDKEKYNLATMKGWKIIRLTDNNFTKKRAPDIINMVKEICINNTDPLLLRECKSLLSKLRQDENEG